WQYFGWPLPNTFYAKHGNELIHWTGYPVITDFFWQWTAMFVLFFLVLLRSAKWERLQISALLIPAVIFPWLYLFIEQMQNIGLRFQYPVLPIYLLLFAILSERLVSRPVAVSKKSFLILLGVSYVIFLVAWAAPLEEANRIKIDTSRAVAVTAVLAFVLIGSTDRIRRFRRPAQSFLFLTASLLLAFDAHSVIEKMDHAVYDNRVQIGKALRPFADRGYTMLTTETGWLPYFSRWRSVDAFGLYDVHVAHHGLNESYMREIDPELIVFHVYSNRYRAEWARNDPRWNEMTQKLFFFAEKNDYALAARVGWPHDCFWYYVKKSCPDASRIISVIANQEGIHYTVPGD
ncbi:MAG: hypothetical protein GXO82_06995, partial [Chlorobi bacterium]|nr:hypothetical protein [Chlorobiota bacterium]